MQGADAILYDRTLLNSLKDNLFWWRMSYQYWSLWRNLHIDGFEGYIWNRSEFPKYQGVHYKFFEYASEERRQHVADRTNIPEHQTEHLG